MKLSEINIEYTIAIAQFVSVLLIIAFLSFFYFSLRVGKKGK